MRTLLISGASRGIGRAMAERLLSDGHRLSLGLRNPGDLKGSPLDPERAGADRVLLHPYDAAVPSDACLLYTSPSPRDKRQSRMPSSA